MKFVEYFRNLDSKKQAIIAGALVITLTGGSMALKLHKEHTNPSTPPVSADEVDAKDKMISQLRVENRKLKQQLNAQKTKSNNSSNELVPYNLNGSLGSLGRYNSTPLNYSSTPLDLHEPTVYEPIIEPVEDEPVIEFEEPTVEPIVDEVVNEVVEPVERPQGGISEDVILKEDEAQLTGGISEEIIEDDEAPTIPFDKPSTPNNNGGVSEEIIEEENNVLDIINSATYKGKKIVFFVEKYLQCKPTYDYLEENGKQILTVNGNGLYIRFEKVSGGDYECITITLDGQERKDLLNTIFEINEGESDNSVVISPDQPPVIEVPSPDQPSSKPVEEPAPEQPKDDKVDTNPDNIGGTIPPAIAPPVTPPSPPQGVEIG